MADRMQFPERIVVLTAAVVAVSLGLSGEERPLRDGSVRMAYLDNGIVKVGVDLDRGGSIGLLADVKKGGNVVNVHDLGRWIGQSYYAGPRPFGTAHPDWKDWPWNPVSAGDVYGNASKLVEKTNDGKTLYVKSAPMQWALKNVPGDCTFETWITLEGRTVQVRNRLTNQRKDEKQYPALDQELPAVYTVGKLHRLMTYTGDRPFADKPLTEIPRRPAKDGRPQWTTFFATERWAALVDDGDWGWASSIPMWSGSWAASLASRTRAVPTTIPPATSPPPARKSSTTTSSTNTATRSSWTPWRTYARKRTSNARNLPCRIAASRKTAATGGS
jgi:hypothetical protein